METDTWRNNNASKNPSLGGLSDRTVVTSTPCHVRVSCGRRGRAGIRGPTQDWTERANSAFRVYPRGMERTGAVAENPYKWTAKYGSLVVTGYDIGTHEGVNEKGFCAHVLYLAGVWRLRQT